MHAVDIGIGSYNDLVVTQSLKAILDIQRSLQQVELLVLIHHCPAQSEAVERLASQTEDSLCIGIAALGD